MEIHNTNLADGNVSEVLNNENEFIVTNEPIMQCAANALVAISKLGKIYLKAKGDLIPNAVSIANIITENLLKNNSKIEMINLDREFSDNGSKMISRIEIVLLKN